MSEALGHSANRSHRWADFVALDEDDPRELIDGELMEIDVPTVLHEWIVSVLVYHLMSWALPRRAGVVLTSGYKVRVRDDRGVMPDVQFFHTGQALQEQALEEGAQALVIEVISPSSGRYDRVEKLNWYASISVPEYWIVDPEQQTLQRHVLEGGFYRIAQSLGGDASFSPDSFEGLTIPLSQLWRLP